MIKIRTHSSLGFSLVSFLFYLMIGSVVMYLSSTLLIRTIQTVLKGERQNNQIVDLCLAYYLLSDDIRQAPAERSSWKKVTEKELIWHNGQNDIGWVYKNNTFIRITGDYDAILGVWKKHNQSLIAEHILCKTMALIEEKDVLGIMFHVQALDSYYAMHGSLMIKTGSVL